MSWNPFRKYDQQDFSNYLPRGHQSFKEKLVADCQRRGVSVFLADSTETNGGVYANLRAVAPESELQSRLLQAIAVQSALKSNRIAWLALFVGLAGLLVAMAK